MSQTKIQYPKNGKPIRHATFAASGRAPAGLSLRGELIGSEGTRLRGITARQPCEMRKWLIVFHNVIPQNAETFRLEIRSSQSGELLASAEGMTIEGLGKATNPKLIDVSISYPDAENMEQCKDNVMAFGTFNLPDTAVSDCNLGNIPADFIHNDDATGFWAAQFTVPANTYTLSVQGNVSSSPETLPDVNCTEAACG